MTEYKSLRVKRHEGVVEVVLIGPGKGNAMGPDFWREMPEAFAELDRDEVRPWMKSVAEKPAANLKPC